MELGIGVKGDPGSWGGSASYFWFQSSARLRIADASCKALTDIGPQRLGEMSALNVGTKGAQKFGLMQLKAMKSPDFSPGFVK